MLIKRFCPNKEISERKLLSSSKEDLVALGVSETLSSKLVSLVQFLVERVISMKAAAPCPDSNLKYNFPIYWREINFRGKKIYFNVMNYEFRNKLPVVSTQEIECYDTDKVIDFLKCVGFQHEKIDIFSPVSFFKKSILKMNILDIFSNKKVTGKDLLEKSYNDLIGLGVPAEDARKLRLTLAPLQAERNIIKFDSEDIGIWAESLSVSKKTTEILKACKDIGKKLFRSKNLDEVLSMIDVPEEDIKKISSEVSYLKHTKTVRLSCVVSTEQFVSTKQKVDESPLVSFMSASSSISSYSHKTLKESLEEAQFHQIEDMLEDGKKKWSKLDPAIRYRLTEEYVKALFLYTYDFGRSDWEKNPYRVVNKALGERNAHALPRLFGYILHLLSALRKLPRWKKGEVLYRGVEGPVSPSVKEVGSVMSWPAFTSTSTDENIVGSFIATAYEPVLFEIRGAFCGYDVSAFSAIEGESEVILEPETTFQVVKVEPYTKFHGATRIVVEVIERPLVIEDVVSSFEQEKERLATAGKKGIAQWELEDCVPNTSVKTLDVLWLQPLSYTFKDAFERAGFGCSYGKLEEEFKAVSINKEKKVSDKEALVIFSYMAESGGELRPYRVVNRVLAERKERTPDAYPYILHLLVALRKLPPYAIQGRKGKIYRGFDGGEHFDTNKYHIYKIMTWPAFTSATYDKNKAYEFVLDPERNVKKKVIFEISGAVRGYDVSDFSKYPGECEVLLEPENMFVVTKRRQSPKYPDVTIISLSVKVTELKIPNYTEPPTDEWEVVR